MTVSGSRGTHVARAWATRQNNVMRHLLDHSAEQLQAWFAERGLPAYRAAQVRRWLFEKRADSFEEMSDLPKAVRNELAADFHLWTSRVAAHKHTADGTEKLLLELSD